MRVDERLEADIFFGISDPPGEPAENHAQEDDGDAPNVRLSGVVRVLIQHFRCKIRITSDDPCCRSVSLSRVVENGGSAKVDELDLKTENFVNQRARTTPRSLP